LDALPIYREAFMPLSCKRHEALIGAASGTELVPNIVDLGNTN